jgi:hypothetical protein
MMLIIAIMYDAIIRAIGIAINTLTAVSNAAVPYSSHNEP